MTRRKLATFGIAALVALAGLGIQEKLSVPMIDSFISVANAVVGRPLSPVSVAGVARRDARRCAAGVECY